MNGNLRQSIREFARALRTHPRLITSALDDMPMVVNEFVDKPEGTVWIAISHTAAMEWADVLEAYLDVT